MSEKRLKELKMLLKQEKASTNPSVLYIADLKETIKRLEKQVSQPAYQMVEK